MSGKRKRTDDPGRRFAKAIGAGLAATALSACQGGGGSEGSTFGPSSRPPSQYSIELESVSGPGCLSAEALSSAMRGLADDASVRTSTASIDSSPAKEGESIRDEFARTLAVGAFRFWQGKAKEAKAEFPSIKQSGCATFQRAVADAAPESFQVVHATANSILGRAENGEELGFELESPTRLRVLQTREAIDFCVVAEPSPHFATARSRIARDWTWGTNDEALGEWQRISAVYWRSLWESIDASRLLNAEPANGAAPNRAEPNETRPIEGDPDSVEVRARALAALGEARMRPELRRCPYVNTAPSGEEPPPPVRPPSAETPPTNPAASALGARMP